MSDTIKPTVDELRAALKKVERGRKSRKAWANFFASQLAVALETFTGALLSMVFLGIAHGFDQRIPAFGYWTMFFLILVLRAFPLVQTINQEGGRGRKWTGEKT